MSTTALHTVPTVLAVRPAATQRCEARVNLASRSNTKLRLTRRGRVLFAAAIVLLGLFLVAAALRPAGAVAEVPVADVQTTTVTVMPGDTLWEVAAALDIDGDVRDVIEQIRTLNNLHGTSLQAGQPLLVPVSAG